MFSSIATSITKPDKTSNSFMGEMVAGRLFNLNDFHGITAGIGVKANSGINDNSRVHGGAFIRQDSTGLGMFASISDNLEGITTGWTLLKKFQHSDDNENDSSSFWLGSSIHLVPSSNLENDKPS